MAILAGTMFSCQSDKVAPSESANGGSPTLSGVAGDPHPRLDSLCSAIDSIVMMSEHDQSLTVSRCLSAGQISPCTTGTSWGKASFYTGIDFVDGIYNNGDDVEYFVANFSCANGWYADQSLSNFGVNGSFAFNNGVPVIDQDWFSATIAPVENKWQLRRRLDELPSLSFDIAMNLMVVKLNLYSNVVNGSSTSLWGYNENWNTPGTSEYNGQSQFVTRYAPMGCLPHVVVVETNTVTTGACSGCRSEVSVEFSDCDSISVSSCKDLSNVVLGFDDCTTMKFDGLSGKTGSFVAPAGKNIVTTWVKSGCYRSGDGPGWGWRVDNPNQCAAHSCTSFSK